MLFQHAPLVLIRTQCREVRFDSLAVLCFSLKVVRNARQRWTCAAVSVQDRLTVGFALSFCFFPSKLIFVALNAASVDSEDDSTGISEVEFNILVLWPSSEAGATPHRICIT